MRKRITGFTLLEVMVILIALSLLIGAGLVAVKHFQAQSAVAAGEGALVTADQAVIAYAKLNRRLPCPDITNDGLENCASVQGQLPYRTLGLDALPLDGRKRPLQYLTNPGVTGAAAAYDYDFCQTLLPQAKVYDATRLASESNVNLAYALVAQGNNDLLNLVSPPSGSQLNYKVASGNSIGARDDLLRSRGFMSLLGAYNCPGIIVAVNSIELEMSVAKLTKITLELSDDQLDTLIGSAETEILLAAFSIVAAAADVAAAIANALDASGQTIFFGNAAATIAAIAATAAAAAAVVAVIEAALIIDGASDDIATHTAQKDLLAHYIAMLNNQCGKLRTIVIAAKGDALSCP